MISIIVAPLFLLLTTMPNVEPFIVIQQLVAGVSPFVLLTVPMFMLATDIMCAGQTSDGAVMAALEEFTITIGHTGSPHISIYRLPSSSF